MYDDCAECTRLWRKYAVATAEHITIENRFKRASSACDAAAVAVLTTECESAADARKEARQDLLVHEENAHGMYAVEAELEWRR
jgi:hypothetical protein